MFFNNSFACTCMYPSGVWGAELKRLHVHEFSYMYNATHPLPLSHTHTHVQQTAQSNVQAAVRE